MGDATRPFDEEVDMPFEIALERFFESEHVIQKCATLVDRDVWKNASRVRWGKRVTVKYFEIATVQRALRTLLFRMRCQLRYRNYAIMYAVKDSEAWKRDMQRTASANGGRPTEAVALPCGLVSAVDGRVVRYAPGGLASMVRILQFRPTQEALERNYRFAVFDNGASFFPAMDTKSSDGSPVYAFGVLQKAIAAAFPSKGTTPTGGALRPVTPFLELNRQRTRLDEAIDYNMTAGLALATPESFVIPTEMPHEPPIEDLDDGVITHAKDLSKARTKTARVAFHEQKFTIREALNIAGSLRRAVDSGVGRRPAVSAIAGMGIFTADELGTPEQEGTARTLLADKWGRMDPTRNTQTLEDFVQVTHGPPPAVPFDIDLETDRYEKAVCRELDIPHSIYRTEVESGGRTAGTASLTLGETIGGKTLEDEIALYQRLFDFVWQTAFRDMDDALFRDVERDLLAMPEHEFALETTQDMLQWLQGVRTSAETPAKLEFELIKVHSADGLRAAIEAQTLGLVDQHLVERCASRVFGHTLGHDSSQFAARRDGRLHSNLNAPLLPPVTPDTKAQIASSERQSKAQLDSSERQADKRLKADAAKAASGDSSGQGSKRARPHGGDRTDSAKKPKR
jgi:hypothetical protein